MYNCQMCGKTVPPNIKCTEVVVQKRRKEYPFRSGVNRPATWKEERQDRIDSMNDYGGVGTEAMRTMKCCPQCVQSFQAAREVEELVKTV